MGSEEHLEYRVPRLTLSLTNRLTFAKPSFPHLYNGLANRSHELFVRKKEGIVLGWVPERLSMYPWGRAIIILRANTFNDNVTVTLRFQKTRSLLPQKRKKLIQLVSSSFTQTAKKGPAWTVERHQLLSVGRSLSPQEVTWIPQCL